MQVKKILLLFLSFLLLNYYPLFAQTEDVGLTSQPEKKIVKSIEVQGNKSISISSILAKIKTRVGQEYLQNVISDDLKRLYNTGYFTDVRVDRQDYQGGFKVIIYVVEKSIVDKVTFSKTKYFNPNTLLKKIKTQKGKFLDNKILKDDVNTIKELYNKKGLTKAEVEVETNIDEVSNKVKVHFIIKEGQAIKIGSIEVEGNKAFKDKRIKKIIKTRAANIFLFRKGHLKDEILEEDMERIFSFYEQNGYIDAKASYELLDAPKGTIVVKINIKEGHQYFVEKITLIGNKIFSDQEIVSTMKETAVNKPFSREKLSLDISEIRTHYFDKGYIYSRVSESTSLNPSTGKVEIKLDIEEGGLAYINRIKIQGNTRTRDIVVRRELRMHPGERIDGEKIRRSKERLKNLGYFEDISFDIEDTEALDKKDLIVQVKEAKTGTFSFGGGYSTVDEVVGFVEIEQRNFDFTNWPTFTGAGQILVLRAESGSTRNDLRISFTEPWLFDYPISAGFDAYITERDKERDVGYAYDEERKGGAIRFGKQFGDYLSGGITYRQEIIEISNFDSDVSADLRAEGGENTVSSLAFNTSFDKTDSVFSPTKGFYVSSSAEVAGSFLGGDKDFFKFENSASYYMPLKFASVLELRGRIGVADAYGDSTKVPIFERYFAGGARTIRGYDERKVGPLDSVTEDPIGGEALLVGNIEYTIPLIDFLKLAAFFDTGNVWSKLEDIGSSGLKSGMGLGLRVKTPIGPVNLDYGYPLDKEPGEEQRSGKFYFSVSRGF